LTRLADGARRVARLERKFKMPNSKHISAVITDQTVTDVLGHVAAIRTLLPFLVNRDPGDTTVLLGDKSAGFDEKSAAYMTTNPEFLPGYLTMAEVLADRAARVQMQKLLPVFILLASQAKDSFDLIGNQIYAADLAYYNDAGDAAKLGRPAAQDIHDDLAARYPGHALKAQAAMKQQTATK